jgi:DNA-binding winged helix-turn-helix (wHTH) protein
LLVIRAGQTVSKEELFAQVWNGAPAEETNLAKSILTPRKALGEKRGENRYIVTEPGHGYRFVEPVSRVMEVAVNGSNGVHSPDPALTELAHPTRLILAADGSIGAPRAGATGRLIFSPHNPRAPSRGEEAHT